MVKWCDVMKERSDFRVSREWVWKYIAFAVWKNRLSEKLALQIRGNRAALGCSIFWAKISIE